MRRLKDFLVLCLMALGGCAAPSEFAPIPATPIGLVIDATQVRGDVLVTVNDKPVGRVPAYEIKTLHFPQSFLRDGQCAVVSVHVIGAGWLHSEEQCLMRRDRYFTAEIVPSSNYIWLVPRS